jgi:hypothetical protein
LLKKKAVPGPYVKQCRKAEGHNVSISCENPRTERVDSVGSGTGPSDGFLSIRKWVL